MIRALFCAILLFPSISFAQATLAGVVKDSSNAVLPGVTVATSSPALIDKTRTATTDGTGQYQIVDLRPGTYSITFSLPGFRTIRREGVEINGAGLTTIDAELSVSDRVEIIHIVDYPPVVDVQSGGRRAVLEGEVVSQLPAARTYGAILAAVPALQGAGANAALSTDANAFFTVHGGPGNEGRVQLDGLTVGSAINGGGATGNAIDTANTAVVEVSISGALGEAEVGGPILNIVPATGGNVFRGSAFGSGAGTWAQANNVDDTLRAFGISDPAALFKLWDVSFAMGGPIKRDKLWFFGNVRDFGNHTGIPGLYANKFAGDPAHWDYAPDLNVTARNATSKTVASMRLTMQPTPRNRFGFYYDYQWTCDQGSFSTTEGCRTRGADWVPGSIFGVAYSPEAATNYTDGRDIVSQATWSSPVTGKLLLEAGYSTFSSHWGWMKQPDAVTNLVQMTTVVPTFRVYRGVDIMFDNDQNPNTWRASATYVTGAHNMKLGYQGAYLVEETTDIANDPRYVLSDLGFIAPGMYSATIRIAPWQKSNRTAYHAFYAQDQWTNGRLTLQGALRFDRVWSWFPAEHNGAPETSVWNAQPITFPKGTGVTGYNDITPRLGVAYDIFGHGKTALKVNVGEYLQSASNQENYTISNPAFDNRNGRRPPNFQTAASRTFLDLNGNHAPDCNMLQQERNGECITELGNFANPLTLTQVNPGVLHGWGVRPRDWQVDVSVQQEILPRTSLEVAYARRWFTNFFVTDNINLSASDFQVTTLTAPVNAKLPDGGGFPVSYYFPKPGVNTTSIQDRYTFASDYGDWTNYWHGVDAAVHARLERGLALEIGLSTGRAVADNCDIVAKVPEMLNNALTNPSSFVATRYQLADSCRKVETWQTQVRGLFAYTIPKIDVLVSSIVRSQPNVVFGGGGIPSATPEGNSAGLSALYAIPQDQVNPQGQVNLLKPGRVYGERINQIDMRFGKGLTFGNTRATIAVDVLNLSNANTPTSYQQNYGDGRQYLQPLTILNPRFARLNVTVDF
jgi:carboxypeptidase family protein